MSDLGSILNDAVKLTAFIENFGKARRVLEEAASREAQLVDLGLRIKSKQAEAASAEAQLAGVHDQLEAAQTELASTHNKATEIVDEARDKATDIIREANGQLDDVHSQRHEILATLGKIQQQHQVDLVSIQKEIAAANAELNDIKSRIEKARSEARAIIGG